MKAEGNHIYIQKPPTAQNYGIGNKAIVSGQGLFNHPRGYIEGTGRNPNPGSLYLAQLEERLAYGVAPDTPTNLSVSNKTPNQLELTWKHLAGEPVEFEIVRSAAGSQNFEKITLVQGKTTFIDENLGDQRYVYRVRAVGEGGKSAYSSPKEETPFFDNSVISVFSLLAPKNEDRILIEPDADEAVTFTWEKANRTLNIVYSVFIDLPEGDFTSPVEILNAAEAASASLHFSRAEELFNRFEIQYGDTLDIQWAVKASFSSFERWSQEVYQMKLIRGYPPDMISEFSLQQPADRTEFIIDPGTDEEILFYWDEASSLYDISYSFYIDLKGEDFSSPVHAVESLESASITMHFSEVMQLFNWLDVPEGDTLNVQWTVKAYSGSFGKQAEEIRQISLIRKLLISEGQTARLDQNYPNPFDPVTTIQYFLEEPGPVRIEVFDISARRIAVFEKEHGESGFHTIDFYGEGLAVGLYFYRMTAGNYSETRKMILIR